MQTWGIVNSGFDMLDVVLSFLREFLKTNLQYVVALWRGVLRRVTTVSVPAVFSMVDQPQTGDVTVYPPFKWRDIKMLLKNPDLEEIEQKMAAGEAAMWPKVSDMRLHCLVEIALKRGLEVVTAELERRGERRHKLVPGRL